MNGVFEWSRLVEFYETDLAGITHFSNFYRWMESAEHAFLRDRGIVLHQEGIGWPRVNASADFRKPIKFGDLVRVTVSIAELKTRSVRYSFEFRVNESDEIHATGEMISVCVDLATMKAIEIPAGIRGLLE
ncbi:acyl-CoA thioesterase [Akkermansiaceae bacterium]|jgi:YbgC/YbaW family acyl-CoA thioester hydrolase|nr:acyl-CoA thioesterase [Akkermansiaceae bacterium]MDA7934470.1 acyl-CoA thioesterase [Akkermansiaceae bacterium]